MSKQRTATSTLKAEGKTAPGAVNAGRFAKQGRGDEPVPPAPISPEPPAYMKMNDSQIAHWKRALENMPPGVAGSSDEGALQALVILWDKMSNDKLVPAEWSQLRGLFNSFGMTPASRSMVSGTGPKAGDEDDHTSEF